MKSIAESAYLKLPAILQNIAVTAYGASIAMNRYGGKYRDYLDEACRTYGYGIDRLREIQLEALQSTVATAIRHSLYYREEYGRRGISPESIRSLDDIRKLPLLEKEEVRKDSRLIVNQDLPKKKLTVLHTTGTSGTPLKIWADTKAIRKNYAYYHRFLKMAGIDISGRRATIWGRIVVSPDQKHPPFWRNSVIMKNKVYSSYHLTDENIPYYIDDLRKYRPDYIDAYPSSVYHIAKYCHDRGIQLMEVTKAITTSGETLFDEQRDIIKKVFGVPVYDQYGAAEMCVFIGQCRTGSYHVNADFGILEFLRDDGTPAADGEEAEMVCTGFINEAMPLIRYRIGDRGIPSDQVCTCGCAFPVVEKILGRIDDVILTPDGKKVGRLSPVVKGMPVKAVQYVQVEIGSLEVNIVQDEGFTEETQESIRNELRKRLGGQIEIRFRYQESIPLGPRGKLRSIVSKIGNRLPSAQSIIN